MAKTIQPIGERHIAEKYVPPNMAQGPVEKAATATKDYNKLVCDWFESAIAVAPSEQHYNRGDWIRDQLPLLVKALSGRP